MTTSAKFRVHGMDCAACVTKIETAVRRIDGVSDVAVGLQTETLSITYAGEAKDEAVTRAVTALGYALGGADGAAVHDHAGHDHDDDHGAPIEGPWWQSDRGRLVIATGLLLAAAYAVDHLLGQGGWYVFLAAALIGAAPVAKRAFAALRSGSVFTIELLMTIAVAGAIAIHAVEEAAVVVFLFAVGEMLEGIAAGRARAGIRALAKIAPATAMVETPSGLAETPVGDIAVGSIIVVRPGDRVPADGVIVSGRSAVDESALTGESVPRGKGEGDVILAGSINTEAVLRMRMEKPAGDTLIARVVRLVEEAADAKAPSERFIERFARWYMPLICGLALAVAVLPPLVWQEPWATWIYRGLALLLIGCPCALVISTPAAIASALAAGARRGLLVKGGGVLEQIGKVKHIAFDKTGTLTAGKPVVTDVVTFGAAKEEDVLRLAAAVEQGSSHPLALAIVAAAEARKIIVKAVASQVLPGKGVAGRAEGKMITVGAAARLNVVDKDVLARAASLESQGKSVSVVLAGTTPLGLIAMRDEPRADAVSGVAEIKALGITPIMLTGDNRANAEAVGQIVGMAVKAELLPEDKLAVIRALSGDGGIAKVGDGINDAPALAAATVGIAMGSGTDVALEAADAAVLNNRISDVANLVRLSRRTLSVIWQNVAIALGLKAVFLVTTVLGMTGLWIAILADTGATVLVTLNALRLLGASKGNLK
ncbi:heavy metal translocating P-type ATPase [Aestuariivirga sp.]|uniref:heavy metal translocating P-type ATPase n=1 Tax=Aestuariivirga sp. TaxID=2650926 RepID=UPI0039E2FC22